jgi:predicted aldo/keto reductase-like oxidoreductase
MERRDFLIKSAVSAGAISLGAYGSFMSCSNTTSKAVLPKREYGKTGEMLSIIGFGGIVVRDTEQAIANRLVARAVEKGVNYFDVAPSYGDAEQKLGPALKFYRKDCFLACKTGERDADGAARELKQSLADLKTDYFDLYQLHAIEDVEADVNTAFAKGGAMEVFEQAKKEGRVRYLGFSAHSQEAAFAAMERYDFDSILFPINFATFYKGQFGPSVIQKAREKGMAILALKGLARQKWPEHAPLREKYKKCWYQPLTDAEEQRLGMTFTLSQPVTAAIPPGVDEFFFRAIDIAMAFKPMTDAEYTEIKTLSQGLNPIFTA